MIPPKKQTNKQSQKKNKKSVTSESANIGGIYNRIIHFFRRIFFLFYYISRKNKGIKAASSAAWARRCCFTLNISPYSSLTHTAHTHISIQSICADVI
jgi:hypothetical protein